MAAPTQASAHNLRLASQPRWWAESAQWWNHLADRPWLAMLVIGAVPLLIRAVMLPWVPMPKPMIADEFSHLLIADTFASGRIVNPPHPFSAYFETLYVFQHPVYASIYPPGHGLVLALGQLLGGHPWWGDWASSGLMCAGVYWMLGGWVSPGWALLGGILCILQFGPLAYWTNSYLGGTLTALGGALALGALPRLMKSGRARLAFVFALGLAIIVSNRPYEGVLFGLATGAILAVWFVRGDYTPFPRKVFSVLLPIAAVILAAAGALAYYNFRITGSPLTMPYQLSQRVYGVPRGFNFQRRIPQPAGLFQDQHDVYRWQYRELYGTRKKWRTFRLFYLGTPLIAALFFLPLAWRNPGVYQLAFVCAVVGGGATLYWYYLNHYVAQLTAAVVCLVVLGLRELWNWKLLPPVVRYSAVATILLLDGVSKINAGVQHAAMGVGGVRYVNFSEKRFALDEQLKHRGGRHLVFVHVSPDHFYGNEWIYNRANIDAAQVVWAREINPDDDARLVNYFAGRSVWVADVDEDPVRISKWPLPPSDPGSGAN